MDGESEHATKLGIKALLALAQSLAVERQKAPNSPTLLATWMAAPAPARHLALLAIGPGRWPHEPTGDTTLQRRFEALEGGAHVLDATLQHQIDGERGLDRLWQLVLQGPEAAALTSVASMCLSYTLPISLTERETLDAITRPDLLAGMNYATGLAARHRCRTARRLALETLGRTPHTRQVIATLRGLGDGSLTAGIDYLAEHTLRAHDAAETWCDAAIGAAIHLVGEQPQDAVELLLAMVVTDPRRSNRTSAFESLLMHADSDRQPEICDQLSEAWGRLPASMRTRLLELCPENTRLQWTSDMSPSVILAGYAQEGTRNQRTEADARELHLQRIHHPNEQVRRETTARLCQPREANHLSLAARGSGGSLVDLPASTFAKSALDQLRLAISAGDAEAIERLTMDLDDTECDAARQAMRVGIRQSDMALRRALIGGLGHIGNAQEDGPFLVQASMRYRSLEGPVAAAIRSLDARHCAAQLAGVFRRRLKWADDDAFSDLLAVTDTGGLELVRDALATKFYPAARAGAARAAAREGYRELVFSLREMSLADTGSDAREAAHQAYATLHSSDRTGARASRGHHLLTCTNTDLDAVTESLSDGDPASLPGLRATLQRGSWRRRVAACRVAALLPLEDTETLLTDALLDVDEDVRLAGLESLEKTGWKPTTPSEQTRAAMAGRRTFGLLSTPEHLCVETLEAGLLLGGQIFRTEVLNVLEHVPGWQPKEENAALVHITRMAPARALTCTNGLRTLLHALDRTWQDLPHRAHIARPLDRVPVTALGEALSDRAIGWRARSAIARALGRPNCSQSTELLRRLLEDEDDDVRRASVLSLMDVGTEDAANTLALGLHSPFREDRASISRALSAMGATALPTLRRLAASPWWEERLGAVLALHAWRGERGTPADILLGLTLDTEHRVSQAALEALAYHGSLPSDDAIAEALGRAQEAPAEAVRPWLSMASGTYLTHQATTERIRTLIETASRDEACLLLPMVSDLRITALRPTVEALLEGASSEHLALRIIAGQTLRLMDHDTCALCNDRGTIACPSCEGEGEVVCKVCDGRTFTLVACTAYGCSAHEQTREIGSLPCKACRGRGTISAPCECMEGIKRCDLCRSVGRLACPLCRDLNTQGAPPKSPTDRL
jgi:HEAT repeat protein